MGIVFGQINMIRKTGLSENEVHGRICDKAAVDDDGGVEAATTRGGSHAPLQTRSMVLTWVLSSMV